jgi:hypothetical protein
MSGGQAFALWVIIIVLLASVARSYFKQRYKNAPKNPDLDDAAAKIELLEERVRVLERIITENKYDLKREIDSL